MEASTSSDEDYIPFGFSNLSISSKKPATPVMAPRICEEKSEHPEALQYYSLLNRAMAQLNKNRAEDTERMKLGLSVVRKGRKTFVNVVDLAVQLNRQTEHLAHFLSKNLLTDGSINKEGQLVLSGVHLQSAVEKALRQFIEIYVVCKACESLDETYICRENKLYFVKCDKCKASRCIGNTIEGYTQK